jgi:UDPglucose--hexose-1-phosphate uridylyltransferase
MKEDKNILNKAEIPFNHWGIINEYNFDGDFEKIPIKKWDPLGSVIKNSQDNRNTQYVGHYSYVSPIRATRPFEDSSNEKDKDKNKELDVFKPIIEGKNYYDEFGNLLAEGYSITLTDGQKVINDPFSDKPMLHRIENNAFTIINRYPAMARVIDQQIIDKMKKSNFLDDYSKIGYGFNLVSVVSHFHDEIIEIPQQILAELFISMTKAIYLVVEKAQNNGIKIIPISPFINHGKMVGGSLDRIHSQVFIDLNEDGHGHRVQAFLNSFKQREKSGCRLCTHRELGKIVYENGSWKLFVSDSPIRNYHLRFAPKEHFSDLLQLNEQHFLEMADVIIKAFKALDILSVNKSRNILFNIRSIGNHDNYHLFADIIPFEFIGGAEMSDSMRVCKVSPNKFAKRLVDIFKNSI